MRAHLPGLTPETIKQLPKEPELAFSRPPDPRSDTYAQDLADSERRLARSQQEHECRKTSCLVYRGPKAGHVCKRHAPFPLAPVTSIDEKGKILLQRLHEFFNTWNPHILAFVRCNNDIKFLPNARDAKAIGWYITFYQTKKQKKSHNRSALLAENLHYHFDGNDYVNQNRDRTRLMLFRCLHILNRQMEQSSQQVMGYLLGFGDRYCSHHYTPMFWSSVVSELYQEFPELR